MDLRDFLLMAGQLPHPPANGRDWSPPFGAVEAELPPLLIVFASCVGSKATDDPLLPVGDQLKRSNQNW